MKGYSEKYGLDAAARHEAGHVLILWLLDRQLISSAASEHGGMTKAFGEEYIQMSADQRLLYAMAGMVMGEDRDVLRDLEDHVDEFDYFGEGTDSWHASRAVRCFDTDSLAVLSSMQGVLWKLRAHFLQQYGELVELLLTSDHHCLDFVTAYNVFGGWDSDFGFRERPKSDYMMRLLAYEFHWKVPRCHWLGWDMCPLISWKYERPTLGEIAKQLEKYLKCNR